MNFCSDKTTILFSLIILIILILLAELKEEYINFPIKKTEYKNIEEIKVNIERERVVSYPVYTPIDNEVVIKRNAEVDVNEF